MMNVEFEIEVAASNGRDACVLLNVEAIIHNDSFTHALGTERFPDRAEVIDWEIVNAKFDNGQPVVVDGAWMDAIRAEAKAQAAKMEQAVTDAMSEAALNDAEERAEAKEQWRRELCGAE